MPAPVTLRVVCALPVPPATFGPLVRITVVPPVPSSTARRRSPAARSTVSRAFSSGPVVSMSHWPLKLRSPLRPAAASGGSPSPMLNASAHARGMPLTLPVLRSDQLPSPAWVALVSFHASETGGSGSAWARRCGMAGGVICRAPAETA